MPPPPPPAELGGSQISSLLEALPGIASVLRSPVADALVKAIRAAAGVGEFTLDDAEELVRYAVRRGRSGRPRRRSRGGESAGDLRPGTPGPTRAAFPPPGAALRRRPPSPGWRRPAAGS